MKEVALSTEINETKKIKDENYRKIKPEGNISPNESRDFIKGLFETPKLEKVYSDYINDLKILHRQLLLTLIYLFNACQLVC